jgi:aspartyl aminopeptidase
MQGADSNLLVEVTERIFGSLTPEYKKEDYFRSIRRSILVSADMAHSIHPNYSEKH